MSEWVLLLGGSTGHGAATAKKLAKDGYGIIAFHFDRGEAKKIAEETISEVEKSFRKDWMSSETWALLDKKEKAKQEGKTEEYKKLHKEIETLTPKEAQI